jgi:REP element-mobilizing transposase RayT
MCTQDRIHLFGEIIDNELILNDCGKVANQCWLDIPNHFPHAKLHEFVIMPNHIHGIIEIVENMGIHKNLNSTSNFLNSIWLVGEKNFSPQLTEFKSPVKTIGSIVRGFKIGVTKWIRNEYPDSFTKNRSVWQRDYFDRIIRDQMEFDRIEKYIFDNPKNWGKDKFKKES